MFKTDSQRLSERRSKFMRSYSESSAHYSRRKVQEEIREKVKIEVPSEREPLIEEEPNQETKRGQTGEWIVNIHDINCNPRHCWKESKKRKIQVKIEVKVSPK